VLLYLTLLVLVVLLSRLFELLLTKLFQVVKQVQFESLGCEGDVFLGSDAAFLLVDISLLPELLEEVYGLHELGMG
jgi:hypothetical protein